VCAVGAYAVAGSYTDILLMMAFGVLGYLFKKLDYPIAPLVLAMVIGDKAEDAFRQSMLMSKGTLGIFFANTLVASIVGLALLLLVLPPLLRLLARWRQGSPSPAGEGRSSPSPLGEGRGEGK
jgi:TctA family transporter